MITITTIPSNQKKIPNNCIPNTLITIFLPICISKFYTTI